MHCSVLALFLYHVHVAVYVSAEAPVFLAQ